ncbi:MAG TPA: hypothetical protein VJL87_04865 [Bdellovibrionota bacterium]|nr:hypothetical protein [Bdellovibrionota bacterium]
MDVFKTSKRFLWGMFVISMLCIPSVGYSDLTEEISSAVKNGDFNLVNKLLVDNQSFSGVFSEVYARILTEMS